MNPGRPLIRRIQRQYPLIAGHARKGAPLTSHIAMTRQMGIVATPPFATDTLAISAAILASAPDTLVISTGTFVIATRTLVISTAGRDLPTTNQMPEEWLTHHLQNPTPTQTLNTRTPR